MKPLIPGCTHDTVALAMQDLCTLPADHVQLDASDIPTAFRLFPFGAMSITKSGVTVPGVFTREQAQQIIDHHTTKGERIPIDCEHFSALLADMAGTTETDITKRLAAENIAAGFADLQLRDDGLWATDITWGPRARLILQEKAYRYFSPVLRGLVKPPMRLTSIALTNNPALDNLDQLVARAEALTQKPVRAGLASAQHQPQTNKDPKHMNTLLTLIAGLIGMDSIALSDDNEPSADILTKLKNVGTELADLRALSQTTNQFLDGLPDSLALADKEADQAFTLITAHLNALADKTQSDTIKLTALETTVQQLQADATARERAELIAQGKKEGKLSEATSAFWADKDTALLSAFLQTAPAIVPVGKVDVTTLQDPDTVHLTAEHKDACRLLGITEDAMLATLKTQG